MPTPAYQLLFDAIVERKDLHSEDGEIVLALMGKISNIACMIPSDRVWPKFSLEIEMIEEAVSRLPDRPTEENCIQCNAPIKNLREAIYGEFNYVGGLKRYGFICPKCFVPIDKP